MTVSTVQLDEIAEVKLGRQRSPKDHRGEQMRPYVRAANVGWTGWKLDDVKTMNFTDAEMETYRLQPGDLLLGEASGSATEVGKPALWQGEIEDCAFQNTLIRVRPRDADPRYLLHYFGHCAATGAFARAARGVGIFHLGRTALAEWRVPLPSIDQQRRIATVLDAANALRAKRRRTIAKLDALTQAVFIDMFGYPRWNPMGWNVVPLGEDIEMGPQNGLYKPSSQYGEGTMIVRIESYRPGEPPRLDSLRRVRATPAEVERYRLSEGDLIGTAARGGDI